MLIEQLRAENAELRKVTDKLKIAGNGDGPEVADMLKRARETSTYWTEYCSLLEEHLAGEKAENAALRLDLKQKKS